MIWHRMTPLALPSTPWCAWPLIDKPGEVSGTVLCRPCVDDDDEKGVRHCFLVFTEEDLNYRNLQIRVQFESHASHGVLYGSVRNKIKVYFWPVSFKLFLRFFFSILGGRQGKLPVAAFEVFDFETNRWRVLPDVPSKRVFALYAHTGTHIVSVGGLNADASLGFTDNTEVFDLATGSQIINFGSVVLSWMQKRFVTAFKHFLPVI